MNKSDGISGAVRSHSFIVPESKVLTYSLEAGSRLEARDYGSSVSLSLISPGAKQDQKRLNRWWQKWWDIRRIFSLRKVYLINDTKWSWYRFRFCSWILRNICLQWLQGRSVILLLSPPGSGYPFLSYFLQESASSVSSSVYRQAQV